MYELDSNQTATLSDIAHQNGREGGLCVYGARVMLDINLDDATEQGNRNAYFTKDTENKELIKIYPNPANDELYVVSVQDGLLELYDLSSKLVLSKKMVGEKKKISLNKLPSGSYIYHYKIEGSFDNNIGKLIIIH